MRRADVLQVLGEHREDLAKHRVKSLALFGSVARDEAGADSDVDLLVEFDRPVGLFAFFDLQEYLEGLFGSRVDLGTPDGLKERIKPSVMQD
ncbi:MAG: nucleotidyltransferase family protein, partial [Dehalococcoidia bacterium]